MAFKAHKMYKGKKSVMANTMADHLRLKKLGYSHTAPKYNAGGVIHPNVKPDNREDLIARYEKGGKVVQGGMLDEVTISAPKYTGPQIKRLPDGYQNWTGGAPPMIGGGGMLSLGKSAFNLVKRAPSLFQKYAPKALGAIGETVESSKYASNLLKHLK